MLHFVEKPTRQPARSVAVAAVTMIMGDSSSETSCSKHSTAFMTDLGCGVTGYRRSLALRRRSSVPRVADARRFRMGRLDHVHIRVPDRTEAAAWYAEHLGFEPVEKFDFWATGFE